MSEPPDLPSDTVKVSIFDAAGDLLMYLAAPQDQVDINIPEGGHSEPLAADVDLFKLPVLPRPEHPSP